MSLVITDQNVVDIVLTAMEDRVVGLEMQADTQALLGDDKGQHNTLREWARARAALLLIKKGVRS